jgi:fructokinase
MSGGRTDRLAVVAGEALMDLVHTCDGELRAHPGGGPYNVARAIGRLGRPVAYLGRVSTDGFGRRLSRQLEEDGVGLEAIVPTEDPTTLAIAQLDDGGAATYSFYTAGTSAPGLTAEAALAAVPARPAILYAGTLGLVLEPMASALEALVAAAADETLVALDPNIRPGTITDAPGFRARMGRVLARADVVKVSEEDLAWLAGETDVVAAARGLLARDDAVALVTRGAEGALVVTRHDVRAVAAPPVLVVDTIGAGDAFMGGFLADWSRRGLGRGDLRRLDDVERSAAFACHLAALSCARAGADPPTADEVRSAAYA